MINNPIRKHNIIQVRKHNIIIQLENIIFYKSILNTPPQVRTYKLQMSNWPKVDGIVTV